LGALSLHQRPTIANVLSLNGLGRYTLRQGQKNKFCSSKNKQLLIEFQHKIIIQESEGRSQSRLMKIRIQFICRKHNYINYSKNHIHLIHTVSVQFTTGGCEGTFWGLRVEQQSIVNNRLALLCFAELYIMFWRIICLAYICVHI